MLPIDLGLRTISLGVMFKTFPPASSLTTGGFGTVRSISTRVLMANTI